MQAEDFIRVYDRFETACKAAERLTALQQDHQGEVTRVARHLVGYFCDPEVLRAIEEIVAKRGWGPFYAEGIVRCAIELRIALANIATTHPTVDHEEQLADADILLERAGVEKAVDLLSDHMYSSLISDEYEEVSGWWLNRRDRGN